MHSKTTTEANENQSAACRIVHNYDKSYWKEMEMKNLNKFCLLKQPIVDEILIQTEDKPTNLLC